MSLGVLPSPMTYKAPKVFARQLVRDSGSRAGPQQRRSGTDRVFEKSLRQKEADSRKDWFVRRSGMSSGWTTSLSMSKISCLDQDVKELHASR